jgi:hypothetical protein
MYFVRSRPFLVVVLANLSTEPNLTTTSERSKPVADIAFVKRLAEADNFFAVLAVARPDGSVHASVVKAGVLDDPEDGAPSVGIVVAGNAQKLGYMRRSGRATAVFKVAGSWAAVDGRVRLEGPDDPAPAGADRPVLSVIRAVFKAAGGAHDDWDEFDRVMTADRRCAVFVRADRIMPGS